MCRPSWLAVGTALLALVVSGCGGGAAHNATAATTTAGMSTTTTTGSGGTMRAQVAVAPWRLPAPVAREVVVSDGRQLTVVGGLDATKLSTAAVVHIDPTTGVSQFGGTLRRVVHDASGARIGNTIVVFGGGGPGENGTDEVQSIPASGPTTVVGKLPQSRSDDVAAAVDGRVYVLGGYDGHNIVADVVSTRDGTSFTRVGVLPVPVRYPAVAVVGKTIYLFGGVSALQGATDTAAVQRLDTTTGKIDIVGRLPTTLSHASAVVLANQVFLLGGYIGNTQLSDQILRFDPTTTTTVAAGHLPTPISDAAAVVIADRGYLVGGQSIDRAPVATVTTITVG